MQRGDHNLLDHTFLSGQMKSCQGTGRAPLQVTGRKCFARGAHHNSSLEQLRSHQPGCTRSIWASITTEQAAHLLPGLAQTGRACGVHCGLELLRQRQHRRRSSVRE